MRTTFAGVTIALVLGTATAAASEFDCGRDRQCLARVMETYLEALIAHDPAALPTTRNVKYTENGVRLNLGDGLWQTASAMPTYRLDVIDEELHATGLRDGDRAFNLTWHDWLNLESLVAVSKVIAKAALKRENSRGAHCREDFPEEGDLATSTFTVVRQRDGQVDVTDAPVAFTIVQPGETLLEEMRAAE